ncbi:MAG TPA: DUF4349 domain-containing protein [Spirochaetota bacterium]|nr:DUF4349 domain-containing protein [Spirochaetota bacterium]HPC41949.1 DUF4349 domain-containing protein [Spirochaetota bacterium]HPL17017.1 DUF4349 domain-containing protein [Spirochaetota bacterium]HQF07005.1 DUF4349 domain-containing protein [Spirochaetota bacterium]HQH95742.1 DUF4349 domain-containing protein [Spirochaetota bacterium]
MNNFGIPAVILVCALALFPSLSCKKAESPREPEAPAALEEKSAVREQAADIADETAGKREREAAAGEKDGGRGGLIGHFLAPMEFAKERLLEYRVDLTYESGDLPASRRDLLGIVAKYGFVKQAGTSLEDQPPTVVSDLLIKSDKIYEALQDLDRVGRLVSENISVTDHTEEMALQERTVKREQLRIARKNAAAGQVAPAVKSWSEIDNSLTQSEDRLDTAEHGKWKIRDKVAWAWVHVNLKGPDRITVPDYLNAVVGMVNFLLRLLWVVIYLLPLAAIAGLIIWKRKAIAAFFRRKKKAE